ncbi:MAG: hypothetical protein R6V07_10835 [Armatimonadota bacterium]
MHANSLRNGIAALCVMALGACAEGTTVVTGQKRPAISADQVTLYTQAPQASYETIALVNASSANGWTDQQSLDYAIEELKSQAAAVGANGVIIGQPGSQSDGFIMIDDIAYPYKEQTVSGSAIYLLR